MPSFRAIYTLAAATLLTLPPLLTNAQTSSSTSPSPPPEASRPSVPSSCATATPGTPRYRPPPLSPCQRRCHGDITCLLGCAGAPPTREYSADAEMEHPTRADILRAIRLAAPRVSECRHGSTDRLFVYVWFAGSGRVCGVGVPPEIEHSPEGICIARVIRAARVPTFGSPYFQVHVPFPPP